MATIGGHLTEIMRKTEFGIKGTPSGLTPENIAKGLLQAGKEELEPEKKGWLPSWMKPVATAAATFPTIVAGLVARKKGERVFTKPAKVGTRPYRERGGKIVQDLQARGYDREDIQKVLDILASAYGEESINVEEYTP